MESEYQTLIKYLKSYTHYDRHAAEYIIKCIMDEHKVDDMIETIIELIESGANINTRSYEGQTLLHYVNDTDFAEYLISKNAYIDAFDHEGRTPLHYLVSHSGNYEIVKLLIENNANLNVFDNKGKSLLHVCHDINIVKLLVENGIYVDLRDNKGRTPLHVCSDGEIYEYLIEAGADPFIKDHDGRTPCHPEYCDLDDEFNEEEDNEKETIDIKHNGITLKCSVSKTQEGIQINDFDILTSDDDDEETLFIMDSETEEILDELGKEDILDKLRVVLANK